jgi:crossover junction endodeoxyribonuclease RusA
MTEPAISPLIFELPMPPSVNSIWRGGKGGRHYLSAKYKAWKDAAGHDLRTQAGNKHISGPYAVEIQASRPDKRRRDIDNLIKPVLDLLAVTHITSDDSECQLVSAEWVGRGVGVRVAVRPCTRWGETYGPTQRSAVA